MLHINEGKSMNQKIIKACQWGFVVATFFLLLYRITLHADTYDEITNLNISYRIAMGDIPFYHCWEAYQGGDIFLAPFIWLFVKATGGTTGIILFSRVLYIMILIVCAGLFNGLFKQYMNAENAFFLSYIIVFFEIYSLFYLWYDTVAIIFFFLGDLAIIYAVENPKKRALFLILGGICHCCMVISYFVFIPMALVIAICIAFLVYNFYNRRIGVAFKALCLYAVGAFIVTIVFLFYLEFNAGIEKVSEVLIMILSDRSVKEGSFFGIVFDVFKAFILANPYLSILSFGVLFAYFKVRKEQKYFWILAFGIVILPILNRLFLAETSVRGAASYLAYIGYWCPLLYLVIQRKINFDRCLLLICWLPFIVSMFLIPTVSNYSGVGPIKAWQMCLPAALSSLYYIGKIWMEIYGENSFLPYGVLYGLVVISLLVNAYSFNFLNQPLIGSGDNRIKDGIYWGIKVKPEMECMVELETMVQEYTKGCETILASGEIKSIYLMTELKPVARMTEVAAVFDGEIYSWDNQIQYFEYFSTLPDIMFLEAYDLMDRKIINILDGKYRFVAEENIGQHNIYIYKLNEIEQRIY